MIHETSVRVKNMWDATRISYAALQDRFLMSCISNHPVVEAVIIHKTKGFSRAMKDQIIVWVNNRIAKRVWLIFTLSRARCFFFASLMFFLSRTSRKSSVAGLRQMTNAPTKVKIDVRVVKWRRCAIVKLPTDNSRDVCEVREICAPCAGSSSALFLRLGIPQVFA